MSEEAVAEVFPDPPQKIRRLNRGARFLCAATLFFMLAWLAFLPPFEGYDEMAHYSSIRQIADTGTIPLSDTAGIAKEVTDYLATSPMPQQFGFTGQYNGALSFRAFHELPALKELWRNLWREPTPRQPFEKTTILNWQAQHPPLYFAIMAPVMRATDGLSMSAQFFVLRLVSALFALTGLWIGLRGTLRHLRDPLAQARLRVFAGLYPLLLPMFYSEFGRLGTDSLCLLLMGSAWALLLRWLEDERNTRLTLALGLVFALGLLTKVFCLAIFLGFCAFLLLRIWQARHDAPLRRQRLDSFFILLVLPLLASFWYVYKVKVFGWVVNPPEFHSALANGGILGPFIEKVTASLLAFNLLLLSMTWVWGGSQNSVLPPFETQLPLYALALALLAGWAHALRNDPIASRNWLPVWCYTPFIAGLFMHIMISVGVMGGATTPGWYLHILAPLLVLMFARGHARLARHAESRVLAGCLVLASPFFLLYMFWIQTLMMAGVAELAALVEGRRKLFMDFSLFHKNIPSLSVLHERVGVFAYPDLALPALLAGTACAFAGFALVARPLLFSAPTEPGETPEALRI